jgi:hypothetical protein
MSTQLDQIAKKAKSNPKLRFTSLASAHTGAPHGDLEADESAGSSGVDGETTKECEQGLGSAKATRDDAARLLPVFRATPL